MKCAHNVSVSSLLGYSEVVVAGFLLPNSEPRLGSALKPRSQSLYAVKHELFALARQASLIHRDLPADFPRDVRPGERVVVLLHGLFASAGVLRPLRRRVERELGARTASFSYAPGPGVQRIASHLARLIQRIPEHAQVQLVGHSLGGVVARWYVQELGGFQRVQQTISLASPFRGTRHARLMPTPAGRDIHPQSDLLQRLCAQAPKSSVPHLSVTAERDQLVTERTDLPGQPQVLIRNCGHNGLLYHPRSGEVVVKHLRRLPNTSR